MSAEWRVYFLRCADGSLYAGTTNDLERRIAAHSAGAGARYTRGRGPVALVYSESAADRGAALRRELELKRLSKREKELLVARGADETAAKVAARPPRPTDRPVPP